MNFNEIEINERDTTNITTSLPTAIKNYIKSKNWRTNELIRLGILAKEDNPQLIERVSNTERDIKILEKRMDIWKEIIEEINKRTMDTIPKSI